MSFICITRKPQQWIVITCPNGDKLRLAIIKRKSSNQSIIGIEAPTSYKVLREEIIEDGREDTNEKELE